MDEREFFAAISQLIASFSASSLDDVADRIAARGAATPFLYPSATFVLARASRSIADLWENGAIEVTEATEIRGRFESKLAALAAALGAGGAALASQRADDLARELLAGARG